MSQLNKLPSDAPCVLLFGGIDKGGVPKHYARVASELGFKFLHIGNRNDVPKTVPKNVTKIVFIRGVSSHPLLESAKRISEIVNVAIDYRNKAGVSTFRDAIKGSVAIGTYTGRR